MSIRKTLQAISEVVKNNKITAYQLSFDRTVERYSSYGMAPTGKRTLTLKIELLDNEET